MEHYIKQSLLQNKVQAQVKKMKIYRRLKSKNGYVKSWTCSTSVDECCKKEGSTYPASVGDGGVPSSDLIGEFGASLMMEQRKPILSWGFQGGEGSSPKGSKHNSPHESSEEEEDEPITLITAGTSQRSHSAVFNSSVPNRGNYQRPPTSANSSRPNNTSRPNDNRRNTVTDEKFDTPNDDNNITDTTLGNNNQNDHHLGDGSHSQSLGDPTINHVENELGHSPGSNEIIRDGENVATPSGVTISEGDSSPLSEQGPAAGRAPHVPWCPVRPRRPLKIQRTKCLPCYTRRFTGGGTVIVDHGIIFVTLICNKNDVPKNVVPKVQPYPRPIMSWSILLYSKVFEGIAGFKLRENDM
ncbi:Biotin/lipoate A/B protein ligase [Artemisia annua]|uniref:Biotin/lipoate A/B protein ligase n=1 Tax=Artemisia annua TaxID=35608 RepID=A0A2U1NVV4_ARTAN|nr:Biotin/lipoate A/B protein ligase [Artemisia annua]